MGAAAAAIVERTGHSAAAADDRNRSITGEIDLILRDPTDRVEHDLDGVSAVSLPLGSRCVALYGVEHSRIDACSLANGLEAMSPAKVRINP
ncbi:hypothetical protein MMSR116_08930 [Methylobacterium mesophilicum SR1.6/6]|uniref:Uncharacterized protein n=1 Tax=Methylobacterium mesophilicum SR1.6/6 TaxID=908290 RepID=A0A6B9FM37_9HYPH|nr:hypothetical protein [Methylobacterium mesophilicum]QGY01988.1 hypothetical protein MMSR116_08930 [Methylobacterium mesophilicum SR1.6/6]